MEAKLSQEDNGYKKCILLNFPLFSLTALYCSLSVITVENYKYQLFSGSEVQQCSTLDVKFDAKQVMKYSTQNVSARVHLLEFNVFLIIMKCMLK
jgi:hypothetical protein